MKSIAVNGNAMEILAAIQKAVTLEDPSRAAESVASLTINGSVIATGVIDSMAFHAGGISFELRPKGPPLDLNGTFRLHPRGNF